MSVDDAVVAPARRTETALSLGVFSTSLVLLLVRFLVPRPVSMSDNGDGFRVLCQAGITWKSRPEKFVHLNWDLDNGCRPVYAMTQGWLAKLASGLGHAVGLDTTLSLVVLGILSSIIAAAALALIVLGLPYGRVPRLVVAGLLLLVMADSAFFGYFSSLFGEGPAFLGLVLMAGGLLLTARPGRWCWLGMAVTFTGGVFAINAKPQMLPLLPLLPLLLIAVLLVRPGGRRGRARWIPAAAMVLALELSTVLVWQTVDPALSTDGTLSRIPGSDSEETNVLNAMFLDIVDGKHDTVADLDALGLPRSFAQYAGNSWWGEKPAWSDPLFYEVRGQFSRTNLANYYLHHPGRTMVILDKAAENTLTARPDYLASFDASAGLPPGTQEFRVPVLSWIAGLLAPLGLFALVPLWLLVAACAWWQRRTPLGVVLGLLLTFAVSQFLTAALGDGMEGVKHQVVTLFATLLALVLAIPFRQLPQFWPTEPRSGKKSAVADGS